MEDLDETQRRRERLLRRGRLALVALVVAYLFLPYELRSWIPVWAPFAAALGLEAHFFLGGRARSPSALRGPVERGPEGRDLTELGGEQWREAVALEEGGRPVLVPAGGLTEDELAGRVEDYVRDPAAAAAVHDAAWTTRTSAHRLRARHLVEGLAVLTIAAAVGVLASRSQGWDAVSPADRVRAETAFSDEATRIAGHPAQISCDTAGTHVGVVQDADGVAEVGGTHAYLVPELCDALYQLAFKGRVHSFPRTARAIAVLAHEAWHLQGVADEGLANCFAFQSGVAVGVGLGLTEDEARSMMRSQLATNASDSAADPRYRVPATCRDGGRHDLDPASTTFP